jgi:alanine racemase
MRPIKASLHLPALTNNLAVVRRHAPSSRLWAVVKANAYGHGLARLLPALASADGLALLELDVALQLRTSGFAKPLLMLEGFFSADELVEYSRHRLTAIVHSMEQVAMLEAAKLPTPVDVYFKVNSGMNRLGFPLREVPATVARLRSCASAGTVGSITLMTHFADADGARGVATEMQRMAKLEGVAGLPRSFANSAAILCHPETHADWVRPGIMLYGCTPFGDEPVAPAEKFGLQPVMTLSSRIIAVQNLMPGDRVGYGGTFTAMQTLRVGVVACGYADGYPRHAPGGSDRGTPILVAGRRTRTVGRVSMDMLFADITGMPEAGVGSEVTLWGEGLSADEVAAASGTVSYELLCALTPRVPVEVIV